jgi:hypothetical protein
VPSRTLTPRIALLTIALLGAVALIGPHAAFAAGAGGGATSLTTVAQNASTQMKTIAGSLVTIILAVSAVVLLIKKDFAAAAGVLVLGLLAASFTTGAGWTVLQSTATAIGL